MRRSGNNQGRRLIRLAAGLSVMLATLLGAAGDVSGADEPGETNSGQRPFVMVLMDSSASMEWTSEESGEYPRRTYEDTFGVCDPYPNQPESYTPGAEMGVKEDDDSYNNSDNPRMFGPCYVWEPKCEHPYERPSWNPHKDWTHHYDSHKTEERFEAMRGDSTLWGSISPTSTVSACTSVTNGVSGDNFPVRMTNASQPRHVTFKEILTGEMILRTNDQIDDGIDIPNQWQRYGPGCWFVPRQRGASSASQQICPGDETFEQYPDHDDPRPHMQEVFDTQLSNGLMDSLGDQIHFAVASFDSYKFPLDSNEYGTDKVDSEETVLWNPNNMQDIYDSGSFGNKVSEDSDPENIYNLGLFQVVGPDRFPSERRYVSDISEIAQTALVDTGTLKAEAYKDPEKQTEREKEFNIDFPPDEDPKPLNLTLNDGVGTYMSEVLLSRQPIAKDTPLGPAIHDIHEYFSSPKSPIGPNQDKFNACRPKHVLMMTDGIPLPEAPASGVCEDIGTEGLSTPFNKDKSKYNYACTEEMIDGFVNDTAADYHVGDVRYDPHVHVVGLNMENGGSSSDETVRKLASMAKSGQTCAGWYLGDRTSTQETNCGEVDDDWIPDDTTPGACKDPTHPCLVEQYGTGGPSGLGTAPEFTPFDAPNCASGGTVSCDYPALILQCSSLAEAERYYANGHGPKPDSSLTDLEAARVAVRECRSTDWYAQALQQIFNTILKSSGLASRTRPAIANELDDPDIDRGGQYRMYSGVRIDPDKAVWGGLLFRERRICKKGAAEVEQITDSDKENPCDSSNDVYNCFHKEIGEQVERDSDGNPTQDNRRIFTSVPRGDVFDYDKNIGQPAGDDNCGAFHSTYMLMESDDRGDFQSTYMDIQSSGNEDNLLNDQRVPFEYEPLMKALIDDSEAPLNGELNDLSGYFGTSSQAETEDLISRVRGRSPEREGRELGAILNSNPVTVEPPKLDVPIDSYREYKARYAQRPTMLYFGTLDGMLHAVHTGELDSQAKNSQVQVRSGVAPGDAGENMSSETAGSAVDQREAWSYIPHMLQKDFLQYDKRNLELMDGSPVVKDVRLCHKQLKYNQNYQACRVLCQGTRPGDLSGSADICSSGSSSTCTIPGPMQWRSVLVQGLGSEGQGYFAMDVTRPGGPHPDGAGNIDIERPDPIPLWEFTPEWEEGQLDHMFESSNFDDTLIAPSDGQLQKWAESSVVNAGSCKTDNIDDEQNLWRQPFLGESVSDPAIGTVVMPPLDAANEDPIRRPVAVFGGGDQAKTTSCGHDRSGHAIYVNDLQTGSVIRRFVGYRDENNNFRPFEAPIVGSPSLHDNSAGSLTTRGFIGDAEGRLYRIDFTGERTNDWDPDDWEVTLFFDPEDPKNKSQSLKPSGASSMGPAVVQPAIALGTDDNLVVIYGLGEPNDSASSTDAQVMIAVKETLQAQQTRTQGNYLWHVGEDVTDGFNDNEKVTGEPVIFNRAVYFTSYYRDQNNACQGGSSRIWGLKFDTEKRSGLPDGVFDCQEINNGYQTDACSAQVFEPAGTTLIRGLAVTLGPSCSVQGTSRAGATRLQNDDQEPQLIAQTGGSDLSQSSGSGSGGGGVSGGSSTDNNFINKMAVGIDAPRSQTIPMSWSVVNN